MINFSLEHTPQYTFLYVVLFMLFLADIQILPIFLDLNVLMVFSLACIYYWAIYHPTLMPTWLLFTFGLLKDLLSGLPFVGLSSIIFICVFLVVRQQRVFLSGQNFFMIWAGYLFICAFTCSIFWTLLCLYIFEFAPYEAFFIEGLIMALSFPLILTLMGIVHKFLPFAYQDKASL